MNVEGSSAPASTFPPGSPGEAGTTDSSTPMTGTMTSTAEQPPIDLNGNREANGSSVSSTPEQRDHDAALNEAPPAHMLTRRVVEPGEKASWVDKVEAFISRLSVRDTFWQRICSLIWLPLAFFSGIKIKQVDPATFTAYLPFTRFNRNWYRAMAGGALLANSEIAGGAYVFGVCGADYTVVCKNLNYTFLRPCYGPAIYRAKPRENLKTLIAGKDEFNVTLDLEISQQGFRAGERERRVGKCEAIFHVTPKGHHKVRAHRRAKK